MDLVAAAESQKVCACSMLFQSTTCSHIPPLPIVLLVSKSLIFTGFNLEVDYPALMYALKLSDYSNMLSAPIGSQSTSCRGFGTNRADNL